MLRAIIFDFDGTIAETERDGHRLAYNAAFAELDLPWSWSVAEYGDLLRVTGGKERLGHYLATVDPLRPPGDDAALVTRVYACKQRQFERIAGRIDVLPGVRPLVHAARRNGIRCAIATTASDASVRAVLAREPQLFAAFDPIVAGDVVAHKKPAPDIYRVALDALDVRAAEAIAIEDSPIGLESARTAGLGTVVVPSEYWRDERFDGSALVLATLDLDWEHDLERLCALVPN